MRSARWLLYGVLVGLSGEARSQGCPQDCKAEEMDDFGCCPAKPVVVAPPPPPPGCVHQGPKAGLLGYPMIRLCPGGVVMGSPGGEELRDEDEAQHPVQITRPFWIGTVEVNQGLWFKVTGANPSAFSECGAECPVEEVSWYDAVRFANALSRLEGIPEAEWCYQIEDLAEGEVSVTWPKGLDCKGYRLPTEAEWEYAARAGQASLYPGGASAAALAWYTDTSEDHPHPVAQKAPNAWGLYDMGGNVWEWVWDVYLTEYEILPGTDPFYSEEAYERVGRGGSWCDPAWGVRAANRWGFWPRSSYTGMGLRLARSG